MTTHERSSLWISVFALIVSISSPFVVFYFLNQSAHDRADQRNLSYTVQEAHFDDVKFLPGEETHAATGGMVVGEWLKCESAHPREHAVNTPTEKITIEARKTGYSAVDHAAFVLQMYAPTKVNKVECPPLHCAPVLEDAGKRLTITVSEPIAPSTKPLIIIAELQFDTEFIPCDKAAEIVQAFDSRNLSGDGPVVPTTLERLHGSLLLLSAWLTTPVTEPRSPISISNEKGWGQAFAPE